MQIKLLIFRPRRKLNITVRSTIQNSFVLTPEKTVTYLSIETEENFSWKKQIEILAKKVYQNKWYFVETEIIMFQKKL